MQRYEYHVVPAPRRGEKARDAKTTADRFAVALTRLMNDLGRDGWNTCAPTPFLVKNVPG